MLPLLQVFAPAVLCRLPVRVRCAVVVVAATADVAFTADEEWDLAALIAVVSDVQRGRDKILLLRRRPRQAGGCGTSASAIVAKALGEPFCASTAITPGCGDWCMIRVWPCPPNSYVLSELALPETLRISPANVHVAPRKRLFVICVRVCVCLCARC